MLSNSPRFFLLVLLASIALLSNFAQAQTSRIRWVAAGHKGQISSASYAPDNSFFVTAAIGDTRVILWDGITGKYKSSFDLGDSIQIVKVSADSKFIAIATGDSLVLWDVAKNQASLTICDSTTVGIQIIAFSTTSDSIAWYSLDKKAVVVFDRKLKTSWSGSFLWYTASGENGQYLAFTKNLDRFAYSSFDEGIVLYSIKADSIVFTASSGHSMFSDPPIAFVNNDSEIAVPSYGGYMVLLDSWSGAIVRTGTYGYDHAYCVHQINSDTIVLTDGYNFNLVDAHTLDSIGWSKTSVTYGPVIPSDWSPDGRYSLEVTSNNFSTTEGPSFDVAVARYDALNMFAPQLITLVSDTVNAVRFSPLNNRVAIASGPLAMLDPEGNNSFSAYDNTGVTGLAYSHDGRSYATTEYTDGLAPFSGQRTRIRDVATNQVQKQFGDSITWNSTRTNQISFAPSDSLFAVGSILHGLDTSIGVKWPAGVYVNAFTPDSRSLYISNNDSVEVIDVASRTIRSTFPTGHHHVNAINFSADGSQFVTCGNDGLIRLWNTPNHTVARTYSGHRGSVTGVQFSPNGLYLLSSSLDSTIRVWDINTGNVVDSFTEFRAPYSDVQVSPDGKLIAGATPLAVVEYDAPKVALGVKPSGISAELSVSELYPNPSADKSVLNLVLPAREHVSIKIVDILGRTLAAPFDAVLEQGHHSFELSASELGLRQGTYFAEIITPARSVLRMLRIE